MKQRTVVRERIFIFVSDGLCIGRGWAKRVDGLCRERGVYKCLGMGRRMHAPWLSWVGYEDHLDLHARCAWPRLHMVGVYHSILRSATRVGGSKVGYPSAMQGAFNEVKRVEDGYSRSQPIVGTSMPGKGQNTISANEVSW